MTWAKNGKKIFVVEKWSGHGWTGQTADYCPVYGKSVFSHVLWL